MARGGAWAGAELTGRGGAYEPGLNPAPEAAAVAFPPRRRATPVPQPLALGGRGVGGGRDAFPRDWGRGDAAWRARQPLRSGPLPRLVPPPAAAKTWRDPDLAEVPREPALLPTLPPTVCPTRSLNGVEGVRGTWAQGRQGFAPSWAPRRCQGGGGMLRP